MNTFVWLATLGPTAATARLTASPEIDSDDPKPSCFEYRRLLRPTFLGEPTAMSEDEATLAVSVFVGVDKALVLCG